MVRKLNLPLLLACLSGAALFTLFAFKLFAPAYVIGENLGFLLMYGSTSLYFWALAEKKGLYIGRTSPVFPLLIFSAFFATLILDALLGINYFLDSATPLLFLVLSPFLVFIGFGWWVLARTSIQNKTSKLRWGFVATVVVSVSITLVLRHVQP